MHWIHRQVRNLPDLQKEAGREQNRMRGHEVPHGTFLLHQAGKLRQASVPDQAHLHRLQNAESESSFQRSR